MTASAISDALIDNLSATSAIGSCQVATHFLVMEQTSACCAVVTFAGLIDDPETFGNVRETDYTHDIQWFVKDTSGNATIIERQLQELVDVSVCSLRDDRWLQGASNVRQLNQIRVSHDVEFVATTGRGVDWYMATGQVDTTEWPGN